MKQSVEHKSKVFRFEIAKKYISGIDHSKTFSFLQVAGYDSPPFGISEKDVYTVWFSDRVPISRVSCDTPPIIKDGFIEFTSRELEERLELLEEFKNEVLCGTGRNDNE